MTRSSIFLFASVLASNVGAKDQDLPPSASEEIPLSLDEAIAIALRDNLNLEIETIDIAIGESRISEARGEFDPTFNLRAIYESIDEPQNQREFTSTQGSRGGDTFESRIFEEENVLFEGSIDGKLPIGTDWSIVAEADRLDNTLNRERPPSLFNPEYDTFFGVRLTQPLLRDFGTGSQLARVRLAVSDRNLASIDWRRRTDETLAEVAKSYYDLLFARQDVAIKESAIALAEELLQGNRRRLDEGLTSPVEVRQAEVAISIRQEALISARHFFRETQNALVRHLYRDFDITQPPRIIPTDDLGIEVPDTDPAKILGEAIANRPEYQANLEQLARQDIQIKFHQNQRLPRLDLVGTLGANGLGDDYQNGFDDSASGDGTQWSAGVVISVPIGNRTANAQLRSSRLEKRQLLLNLKQIEVDIAIQIDTARSRIETTLQRLETAKRSAESAQMVLDEERKRMQEGVTNSFEILVAQDEFATAKTRATAAEADLQKAVIDLWLASGTLLPNLGIDLVESTPADYGPES